MEESVGVLLNSDHILTARVLNPLTLGFVINIVIIRGEHHFHNILTAIIMKVIIIGNMQYNIL